MTKINYVLPMVLLLLLSACTAHKNSFQNENEVVEIILHEFPDSIPVISESSSSLLGSLSTFVPIAIEWGVHKVGTAFEKEAKKYRAEYSMEKRGDKFYLVNMNGEPTNQLRYDYMTINRTVHFEGRKTDAMTLRLNFELDDSGKLLYLQPTYLKVDNAKAKLRKDDNNLDLIVSIDIDASWINKKQVFQKKEIANLELSIKNIELGKEYIHQDSRLDKELSVQTDWFPPLPISEDSNGNLVGYGNYSIAVSVTEVDDYGKRVSKNAEDFQDYESKIVTALKKLVDE